LPKLFEKSPSVYKPTAAIIRAGYSLETLRKKRKAPEIALECFFNFGRPFS